MLERARRRSWGQRDKETGMQRLRTGLPQRAAGRHDGASLRIPRRRSGADTSEARRNPDAAAKYLLWKNYPIISDGNGRLRRRNAASLVPGIFHSERTLAETGRSCALSVRGQPPGTDDGRLRQKTLAAFRFRRRAKAAHPLPPSSFSSGTRCAGLPDEENGGKPHTLYIRAHARIKACKQS